MATTKKSTPPRLVTPGDVVAAFSEHLGEWTAAQITDLDPDGEMAGVLELDWSGPEPTSVADLGEVTPVVSTRGAFAGRLEHCKYDWVLPRSYKVIGTLPLLCDEPSSTYAYGWGDLGLGLVIERRRRQGEESSWSDPWAKNPTAEELAKELAEESDTAPEPDEHTRRLRVGGVASLDCERLVARYPNLTGLTLFGLGNLVSASSLNKLSSLRTLFLVDMFGMTEADCLRPEHVPALESLELSSVPAEYAAATKALWSPEAPKGVSLRFTKPRKPSWVTENLNNPLRDWDGREEISAAIYKKSVAQFKKTRRAVLAALASGDPQDVVTAQLEELGEEFGEVFNELDKRAEFIMTIEREELYDALDAIITEAEEASGADLEWAGDSLTEGCDSARDW